MAASDHVTPEPAAQPGPALTSSVSEVQGRFPNDAALQDAIGRVTLLGVDRADISLPHPDAPATPDAATPPATSIDTTQVRTMASGITGTTAGMAVAAVLATGGLAAPVVAAAAGLSAVGAVAATTGVGRVAGDASVAEHDRLGAEGKLLLAVRVRHAEQTEGVVAAMREAGGQDVAAVVRQDASVDSTGWTG